MRFFVRPSSVILFNMYGKTLSLFLFLVLIALVGNIFLQREFAERAIREAEADVSAGNYLASIAKYENVKSRAFGDLKEEAAERLEASKEFLVAEANFKKAKEAAEEGDWLKTKVLLSEDPALVNSAFSHYEEAINLFLEASEKVRALEKKIEAELEQLKREAAQEKKLRETVETQVVETKSKLEATITEKKKTEEALRSEIEEQSEAAEKARAEAEAERLAKFKNELDVYVSMLLKGNGHLDSALVEVGNKKDTTALLFVGQAKALFDEAELRGKDLRDARTPESLKEQAEKLLTAASLFIDASRRIGNLVFYIGKESDPQFNTLKQEAAEKRNSAEKFIQELKNFVR